jgi:hypothetical protein
MAAVRFQNLKKIKIKIKTKRRRRKNKNFEHSNFFQTYGMYREISKFIYKQRRMKLRTTRTLFFDKFVTNFLLSNRYYYNTVEDAYMNKVGFFKTQLKILKQIRLKFLKRVKMNFFSSTLIKSNKYFLRPKLSTNSQLQVVYKFEYFY